MPPQLWDAGRDAVESGLKGEVKGGVASWLLAFVTPSFQTSYIHFGKQSFDSGLGFIQGISGREAEACVMSPDAEA